MNFKLLIVTLISLFTSQAYASKADKWNIYASYSNITEIEPTGTDTYVLASNNLFSYHLKDGAAYTYTKANILSDSEINHIAWIKATKKLLITYTNGNIDLLYPNGEVSNIPDLYLKSIAEDKTINHIYVDGIYAYLSCPFGIIKLNTRDEILQETYQLGFSVNYSYTENGNIYAASASNGLYQGAQKDNLLDKNNWTKIGDYAPLNTDKTQVYDNTNKCWWGINAKGQLTYYTIDADNNKEYQTEGIQPDGPASNRFYKMYLHKNKIYSVAGKWAQEKDGEYPGEVHVWDGNSWTEFEQPSNETIGHRYVDLICMDFDPQKEGHVMVGAKGGIYEFQDEKFVKSYDRYNSPLQSCANSNNYLLITGLKYDQKGYLWVANSTSDKDVDYPLRRFAQSNNEWKDFSHAEMNGLYNGNLINFFYLSYDSRLWFVNNWWESNKLYAYNTETDELTNYGPNFENEDGTILTPRYLFCATEDQQGNIWLGTSVGPLYLERESVRNGSTEFIQHKVPRNDGTNYADYLLSGIEVRSIAVDAGNRKWMGTSNNGLYVISDDCNTQVEHFDTDNSPLPSNIINDILIMPDGLVYIATEKGLCSYKSDVSEASSEMTKDNVYAYPNPVKPDYSGDIHIVGLTKDADIKIVSSNGWLINQGRSTGGSYSWNGCDQNGNKVASGIYMVQTATANGEKGTVCKIAIIR